MFIGDPILDYGNLGIHVLMLIAIVEMRVKVGVMWLRYLKERNGNEK